MKKEVPTLYKFEQTAFQKNIGKIRQNAGSEVEADMKKLYKEFKAQRKECSKKKKNLKKFDEELEDARFDVKVARRSLQSNQTMYIV